MLFEDLRRGKFVSLAWRRELKTCYDNWRNTGARCYCFGVSLFLDREFKLQARNLKHVISYQLQPFVLTAELKLRTCNALLIQTRGHEGAYRGRAPLNDCLCSSNENCSPSKRGPCPEEINRLGAIGVQIEAQIGVFCGLPPDFMTILG